MSFHDNVARHLVEDEPDNSMPAVCWQTPPRAARALPETPMPVERTRQRYTCDNIQHIAFGPAKPSVLVSTPDASTLVAACATIVPAWATLQKAVAMSNDWQQQQYQRLLPTPALLMPEHALSSRRMQIQCAGYESPLLPVTRISQPTVACSKSMCPDAEAVLQALVQSKAWLRQQPQQLEQATFVQQQPGQQEVLAIEAVPEDIARSMKWLQLQHQQLQQQQCECESGQLGTHYDVA